MTHEVTETEALLSWIEEIPRFKKDKTKPDDLATARRLRQTQAWYCIVDEKLYRRAFSQPLLRCLVPSEAEMVLVELYEGIYGEHTGG